MGEEKSFLQTKSKKKVKDATFEEAFHFQVYAIWLWLNVGQTARNVIEPESMHFNAIY